jgi:hypothetical protein
MSLNDHQRLHYFTPSLLKELDVARGVGDRDHEEKLKNTKVRIIFCK